MESNDRKSKAKPIKNPMSLSAMKAKWDAEWAALTPEQRKKREEELAALVLPINGDLG